MVGMSCVLLCLDIEDLSSGCVCENDDKKTVWKEDNKCLFCAENATCDGESVTGCKYNYSLNESLCICSGFKDEEQYCFSCPSGANCDGININKCAGSMVLVNNSKKCVTFFKYIQAYFIVALVIFFVLLILIIVLIILCKKRKRQDKNNIALKDARSTAIIPHISEINSGVVADLESATITPKLRDSVG